MVSRSRFTSPEQPRSQGDLASSGEEQNAPSFLRRMVGRGSRAPEGTEHRPDEESDRSQSLLRRVVGWRRRPSEAMEHEPKAYQTTSEQATVFGPGDYSFYLNFRNNLTDKKITPVIRDWPFMEQSSRIRSDQLQVDLPEGKGLHPLHERVYALLNSSEPIPSPVRPPEAKHIKWHDGTQVWVTPFTREARAYGSEQIEDDTCSLMATQTVLRRQIDPEKRNPQLEEEFLLFRAEEMGFYQLSRPDINQTRVYYTEGTSFDKLPDLWQSFGSAGQYIGVRCDLQKVDRIAPRMVAIMALLHAEGRDLVTRIAPAQIMREYKGRDKIPPSKVVEKHDVCHTLPYIGFAYRYDEANPKNNELVGAIVNESFAREERYDDILSRTAGAGMAVDRCDLEAGIFGMAPPGFRLSDGRDCIMQMVITERAIPRF